MALKTSFIFYSPLHLSLIRAEQKFLPRRHRGERGEKQDAKKEGLSSASETNSRSQLAIPAVILGDLQAPPGAWQPYSSDMINFDS